MSRVCIRDLVAALVALTMGVVTSAESARGALAGHPSYSANLSVNATLRKQQLICDPAGSVYGGSTSTLYQPSLVSLSGLQAVNGFNLQQTYVEVRQFVQPSTVVPVKTNTNGTALIKTSDYFANPPGTFIETGYMQTYFQRIDSSNQTIQNPDPGYTFLAEDGFRNPQTGTIDGDDTHYMFFQLAPGAALDAPSYTNFADQNNRGLYPAGGPQRDTITELDAANGGPGRLITDNIDSATVPEPATALAAAGLGLLPLLFRPRRRSAPHAAA